MRIASKFVVAALAALGWSAAVQAAPQIQILNNSGVWRDTFYATSISSSITEADPYGKAPLVPMIEADGNGWTVTFAPSAEFQAMADNSTGGERQVFDGELSFLITFDAPVHLVTSLSEDGIYRTKGNGTVDVTGGLIVTEADHATPWEIRSNYFPVAALADGFWSLTDQVAGFNGSYTTYKISLDNILQAQSLASPASGSALIAKKDFTLTFNDGSGTPVPEPAALGVLTTGCLALLARRRRA